MLKIFWHEESIFCLGDPAMTTDLGERLRQIRQKRGLSQRELAKRLGVPEQQVQRYEATLYAGASLQRLQEIAETLGLEIEEHARYAVPA